MIDHEKKFVFLHIPKTAGMSIGTLLYDNLGIEKVYEGFKIHHDDLTEDILRDYFVFTFVRNPWDRLYSQYKFRNWLRHTTFDFAARNLETLFKVKYGISIEEMLEKHSIDLSNALSRANFYAEFVHLPSQVQYLQGVYNDGIDKFPYIDYIGRFENLQEDFTFIAETIGLQNSTVPYLNRKKSPYCYTEMYSEDLKEYVGKKYIDDITKFNYTFNGI